MSNRPWVMWGTKIHAWMPRSCCRDVAALTDEQKETIAASVKNAAIKSLIAGDEMETEKKRMDSFKFVPQAEHIFLAGVPRG